MALAYLRHMLGEDVSAVVYVTHVKYPRGHNGRDETMRGVHYSSYTEARTHLKDLLDAVSPRRLRWSTRIGCGTFWPR
jgi:hypothetical protein